MEDVIKCIDEPAKESPIKQVLENPFPDGDYAVVEILGHQTLIGRVREVERFGTSMLQIEPIFKKVLLSPILQGGSSIYRFSPCTAEKAFAEAPEHDWQLPSAVRSIVPDELLDEQPKTLIEVRREDYEYDEDEALDEFF